MTNSEFEERYQAAIPKCCELQTFEAHAEVLMLCWGITYEIQNNTAPTSCGICEFNTDPEAAILRKEYEDQQLKKRVWDVISTP